MTTDHTRFQSPGRARLVADCWPHAAGTEGTVLYCRAYGGGWHTGQLAFSVDHARWAIVSIADLEPCAR